MVGFSQKFSGQFLHFDFSKDGKEPSRGRVYRVSPVALAVKGFVEGQDDDAWEDGEGQGEGPSRFADMFVNPEIGAASSTFLTSGLVAMDCLWAINAKIVPVPTVISAGQIVSDCAQAFSVVAKLLAGRKQECLRTSAWTRCLDADRPMVVDTAASVVDMLRVLMTPDVQEELQAHQSWLLKHAPKTSRPVRRFLQRIRPLETLDISGKRM